MHDGVASIISAYGLVLDLDAAELALIDQFVVLCVADLAFGARLELLVAHLLDHGRIGIQVLSLQLDLFELLGKALLLRRLVLLLLRDLVVGFHEALVSSCLQLSFIFFFLLLFLISLGLVIYPALFTSLLYLVRLVHQLLHSFFLSSLVLLSLGRDLLLSEHLVVLEALTEFGDGHLIEEAVARGLRRVETLGTNDRDTLELTDLTNQLLTLTLLNLFLLLAPLHGLSELLVDLVPDAPVLLLNAFHLPGSVLLLGLHGLHDLLLFLPILLLLLVLLRELLLQVLLKTQGQDVVRLLLLLGRLDRRVTGELHLDLFLLDVLDALDLLFFVHFTFPSIELTGVSHVDLEVLEDLGLLFSLDFELVALSEDSG